MNKKYAGVIVGIVVALASAPSYAQLGGLANSFLGGKESAGKSVTAESIVEKYVAGSKDVMTADVHFLNALGLKEQAAKEELAAKNLTEGATVSGLEDAAAIQTESSKLLADKMNEKKWSWMNKAKRPIQRDCCIWPRGCSNTKDWPQM